MMLKLKPQYFGHLMRRVESLEKTLMLGGIGGRGKGDDRGWDGWMASLTDGREFEWTPGVGDGQGGLACCDSWGHKESDTTERLNGTELKQSDNIQPWRTPFPTWNQSVVPCPVLTVTSWPVYRFLRRQVRWCGFPISWRIFRSLWWSTQSRLWHSQ